MTRLKKGGSREDEIMCVQLVRLVFFVSRQPNPLSPIMFL